jgi:serine protease AprX
MDGKHTTFARFAVAVLAIVPAALAPIAGAAPASAAVAPAADWSESVIVRVPSAGHLAAAEDLVASLGGRVTLDLSLINGFAADLPASRVSDLAASAEVSSVTPDASVHMNDAAFPSGYGTLDPTKQAGSLYNVVRAINADDQWNAGYDGSGVDVAVLDTGLAPVTGLTGQYVNGPDLSLDALGAGTAGIDAFGHGTAMASIVAGRDPAAPTDPKKLAAASATQFLGVAPGSRVVNVKVGAFDGATDVSQVIAAIEWVVQHAHDSGRNIRVLNLSFGTDGVQDYVLDPLTYATEVAWRKGIVVVVSAGNTGVGSAKLNDPAYDPYVIAVGAQDLNGTAGTGDDFIADFSTRGDATRHADVVAPGTGIVGLRDPGSNLDAQYPAARQGDRFFRGSGTSQAAAVVSGAVALLLQRSPAATPDQVKSALVASGPAIKTVKNGTNDPYTKRIDLHAASDRLQSYITKLQLQKQLWTAATGLGSIDASRGSFHLTDSDGNVLAGEQTIFGDAWNATSWTTTALNSSTWSGDQWLGRSWTDALWDGRRWSGDVWDGRSWSGSTWSGSTWSGSGWSGSTWSGRTWSGSTWSGSTWSGSTWSSGDWS